MYQQYQLCRRLGHVARERDVVGGGLLRHAGAAAERRRAGRRLARARVGRGGRGRGVGCLQSIERGHGDVACFCRRQDLRARGSHRCSAAMIDFAASASRYDEPNFSRFHEIEISASKPPCSQEVSGSALQSSTSLRSKGAPQR